MSLTITIKEVKTVTKVVRGEHTVIDQKQEKKEYPNIGDSGDSHTIMKNVYGYAPDREEEVIIETKIFEQTVDSMNLQDVIRAINGL